MNVVAIAASDEALVDAVMIGFGEVGLGRGVTSVTQIGLRARKQVFGFLRVVRGVAVEAANIAAGMD